MAAARRDPAPGMSCLFQGGQLVPGSEVQMVGGSGTIPFESEVGDGFPREKGRLEPVAAARLILETCYWLTFAIYRGQRYYGNVKRTGRVTRPAHGQRSTSQTATRLQ